MGERESKKKTEKTNMGRKRRARDYKGGEERERGSRRGEMSDRMKIIGLKRGLSRPTCGSLCVCVFGCVRACLASH